MNILLLIGALLTKHFICDFPLQTHYQYMNKGYYGHLGGILHASIHAVGTLCVFYFFVPLKMAILFAIIDGLVHYHIDWSKANLNRYFQLTPDNGHGYWVLFGFDQWLHQMTYILLVLWAM